MRSLIIALFVFALAFVPSLGLAEGFPVGDLIATDYSSVYAINPTTGAAQTLLSGQTGLGDVVYNPVTGSAFICTGSDVGGSTILQLKWSSGGGFQATPFLTGLDYAHGLAVDGSGNVYFGQGSLSGSRLLKASPAGNVTPLSSGGPYLWTPQYLAFSPDESNLYVSTSPNNKIEAVALPGATVSNLVGIDFPGGLDVAATGTIYATEGPVSANSRIVSILPSGVMTAYDEEPWMSNGLWGDLEFDDTTGKIYVNNANHLYAIDSNKVSNLLFSSSLGLKGLDFITSVPEPSTFVLLGVGAISLLGYAWRRKRTA